MENYTPSKTGLLRSQLAPETSRRTRWWDTDHRKIRSSGHRVSTYAHADADRILLMFAIGCLAYSKVHGIPNA